SYRWWVRADSRNGTTGPWSAPTDFAIAPTAPAAPVPVGPSGILTTDQPTFTWSAVGGATSYDVWLTDLSAGEAGQVIGSSATTSLLAPSPLSRGSSYRWWVRADSANGTAGPWSAATDFAIAGLTAPVPSGPSGILTTDLPTFTWS